MQTEMPESARNDDFGWWLIDPALNAAGGKQGQVGEPAPAPVSVPRSRLHVRQPTEQQGPDAYHGWKGI